jgi:hypothetical protein
MQKNKLSFFFQACAAEEGTCPPEVKVLALRGPRLARMGLLSVVLVPQHMPSHLFCLLVVENVAQQLESCLVKNWRLFSTRVRLWPCGPL